jgi:hypothetical protein
MRARLSSNASRWSQPGSNRRPPACHAGALPAELWPQERLQSSLEREVFRPVDSQSLVVPTRDKPKTQFGVTVEPISGNEEASIQFRAVCGDRVDLGCHVRTFAEALAGSSRRVAPNRHYVTVARRPLALSANEPRSKLEDQVIPTTFNEWPVNADAKIDRRVDDRRLGNCAFLVGGKHQPHRLVYLSDNTTRGATLSTCTDSREHAGFAGCLAASLARSARSSAATTGASRGMTRRVASAFASRVGRLLRPSRAGLRSSSRATTRTIRPRRSRLRARPKGRRSRALRAGRSSACRG